MIIQILLFGVGLLSFVVVINRYYLGRTLLLLRKREEKKKGLNISSRNIPEADLPTVTVIIPLFNEGEGIYHTIKSLLNSVYPREKLSIIVVDDCSTDDSYEWARLAKEGEATDQVTVIRNPVNMGKRKGISKAVHMTQATIIISVDSDVIVDKNAVSLLIHSFGHDLDHESGPNRIAAVGGKVKVLNRDQNWLTKMQTIKYYLGYEFLKALENGQRQVMCLSGCLTAYRREVLLEVEPVVENRNMLGIPIKYGEDRYLTRQIVKAGHQTVLNLDAFCFTKVPPSLPGYFKQQLRWRRSNFVDFLGGISHLHRLRPLVAVHYVSVAALQFVYPLVVVFHILYSGFFSMLLFHLAVLLFLSLFYLLDRNYCPPSEKVNPLWFLAMGVLMPVTYLFLSPLALFTLDSGSWETRKK